MMGAGVVVAARSAHCAQIWLHLSRRAIAPYAGGQACFARHRDAMGTSHDGRDDKKALPHPGAN
jgi:hypothetical protein